MTRMSLAASLFVIAAGAACIGAEQQRGMPVGPPAAAQGWQSQTVASGLRNPWGMTFLPDGRMLVTGRFGNLYAVLKGRVSAVAMEGLPTPFTGGQGGLMDIALHPKFAENGWVYMTLSTGTSAANRTVLVRGKLQNNRLSGIRTLFTAQPSKSGGEHFGSRLLWLPDGTLLMSIGDGGNPPRQVDGRLARENGQRLDTHLGAILRLDEEGKAASGNPFQGRQGARAEIYTYGHRNIQGMVLDLEGRVWATEHGPKGGDELNLIQAGKNYGWPRATFGRDYRTNQPIGQKSVAGMEDPRTAWVPAHAPSGLAYYTGDAFPTWRGSLFSGGLVSEDIRRIALDGSGNVIGQNRLLMRTRIRDVRQGPDGQLYALTDGPQGRLLRIAPRR